MLRRLPAILAGGLAIALAYAASAHVLLPDDPAGRKAIEIAHAYAAGGALLHLTVVGTVGLACFIVYVMKGPAFVADAYPLPDADSPATAGRDARGDDAPSAPEA